MMFPKYIVLCPGYFKDENPIVLGYLDSFDDLHSLLNDLSKDVPYQVYKVYHNDWNGN